MFIIRMTQAQGSTRGVISYSKQNFEQINNECYILYQKVCQILPWNLYQNIMRKNLIKITGLTLKKGQRMSASNEKNITKIICAIISGFHFDIPDVVDELEKTLETKKKKGGLQEILTNIFGQNNEKRTKKKDDGLASDSEDDGYYSEGKIQEIENILDKQEEVKLEAVSNKQAILNTLKNSFLPSLFKHLKDES